MSDRAFALLPSSPLSWIGRTALSSIAYLGGVASVPATAARALVERSRDAESSALDDTVAAQLGWMFAMGIPLVGLVHVGIGSFLSMQSYFGGTFADGTGAVVGVGLLRNLAPLLAGMTLAGIAAARITPELRARMRAGKLAVLSEPRAEFLARTAAGEGLSSITAVPISDHALAARLIATTVAGPVLAIWASAVGTVVGWQVAQTLMGVTTHSFFSMFWEMLWLRDLTGLVVKGLIFGLFAGVFACHEGLRGSSAYDLPTVSAAACRAACLATIAILIVNSGWFVLVYHAGPAFGPTLLAPPSL
jgi:phospholipid/cholesterol/gamma-HCH transport system permease protein